jgi:FAD/FMN-containing dehydrogenase
VDAVVPRAAMADFLGEVARIGTAKVSYFLELADPAAVSLMRRIKDVFDPAGILNPGVLFG